MNKCEVRVLVNKDKTMVKCSPKNEFLNLAESKNPQKVQKGANF